jgi:hypothetical protein
MLSHAYKDNYDVAVLVTGDADYLPLVDEVQRQGKVVVVAFFDTSHGLDVRLGRAADHFIELNEWFQELWARYVVQVVDSGGAEVGDVRIPERPARFPSPPAQSSSP